MQMEERSLSNTPELSGVSEIKFKSLREKCLSMMLQAGLPTNFWWGDYEISNYLKNRLHTKTVQGYMTPFEALTKHCPDLSHLRIWGCKARIYHI